jgi:hypothetical protein
MFVFSAEALNCTVREIGAAFQVAFKASGCERVRYPRLHRRVEVKEGAIRNSEIVPLQRREEHQGSRADTPDIEWQAG